MTKQLLTLSTILIAAILSPMVLSATEITVGGSASGYISSTYTPGLGFNTYPSFTGTTVNGIYNFSDLSTITLPTGSYTDNFTLGVSLNQPYQNPQPSYFTFTGKITSNGSLVSIIFNAPTLDQITYVTNYNVNPNTTGTFYFGVNNTTAAPGSTVTLTGFAEESLPTSAPEPASYGLIAGGLSALVLLVRRRRQA